MNITVIVCTYNRAQTLAVTLDSLAASEMPDSLGWEVLVVDNNSRDQTQKVVDDFCRRFPKRFRYLREPKQGKTLALNAGIREAKGNIVAFTDDDVIVDPNWLKNLTASLQDNIWAGAGGRTFPERGFSPPRWLPGNGLYALAPLAIFDRGSQAQELKEAPFGNNAAYRKAMFEKHGGFREDLGPRPGSGDPQKSEDSEFGARLLARGERFRYEPSAVLYHAVPESRLRKEYFLEWWFDKARADIQAFGVPSDAKRFVSGVPTYLFRRLTVWTLRWLLAVNVRTRFENKLKVWSLAGTAWECHRISREERKKREGHGRR